MMTYGSGTWVYLKSVQNMVNVFEIWCYRIMLRISWMEHVTNEEVNTKPTSLGAFLERRLAFHVHLVRKGCITFDLMIGRLRGRIVARLPLLFECSSYCVQVTESTCCMALYRIPTLHKLYIKDIVSHGQPHLILVRCPTTSIDYDIIRLNSNCMRHPL